MTAQVHRPSIDWIPVHIALPPKGRKVQGLTRFGVHITGDLHAYALTGYVVCWAETPKRPEGWDILLQTIPYKP